MSFQVSAPSMETWKLAAASGNPAGNRVETVGLKALARKVLRGNRNGNKAETAMATDGNFEGKNGAKVSSQFPPLAVVTCHHCGARFWHHLGHLAEGGKIAGGPCCFGHPVLTVEEYPTETDAAAAYPWPEVSGEPEHGACNKCGADTTACTTYPDGRMEWICSGCYGGAK